jgi:hypothetical protein
MGYEDCSGYGGRSSSFRDFSYRYRSPKAIARVPKSSPLVRTCEQEITAASIGGVGHGSGGVDHVPGGAAAMGTSNPRYATTCDLFENPHGLKFVAITAMNAYQAKSCEELRMEDYAKECNKRSEAVGASEFKAPFEGATLFGESNAMLFGESDPAAAIPFGDGACVDNSVGTIQALGSPDLVLGWISNWLHRHLGVGFYVVAGSWVAAEQAFKKDRTWLPYNDIDVYISSTKGIHDKDGVNGIEDQTTKSCVLPHPYGPVKLNLIAMLKLELHPLIDQFDINSIEVGISVQHTEQGGFTITETYSTARFKNFLETEACHRVLSIRSPTAGCPLPSPAASLIRLLCKASQQNMHFVFPDEDELQRSYHTPKSIEIEKYHKLLLLPDKFKQLICSRFSWHFGSFKMVALRYEGMPGTWVDIATRILETLNTEIEKLQFENYSIRQQLGVSPPLNSKGDKPDPVAPK